VICAALKGKPFEFSGEYFNIHDTVIFPQPIQQPPPSWVVVNTKVAESVEFSIERNINILTGVLKPFSKLTNIREQYPAMMAHAEQFKIGTQRPVFVSYDANEVIAALDEVRWNARTSVSQRDDFGQVIDGKAIAEPFESELDNEQVLAENAIFETPEQCIEKIKLLQHKLGCNYFSANF
jgi:alkanesulfonate monooxygenase SsuD/methylene tetrahydromethanopterin reductase-like flavin-dependent oxidoreductase (luciferase family)